ncbi:Neugrin-domain-containing protein [Jimgerdemannia flammicorona]|uniref:Required for respiratory growth protein 9, mitochondrial n=1 Tax=Jimgerdemannia flammicorona TaxID=994334 RepID=A0A433QQY7_9FUNG|nr:Neugrin-domain-containing protein [Jimgerdemannia flammicorona]
MSPVWKSGVEEMKQGKETYQARGRGLMMTSTSATTQPPNHPTTRPQTRPPDQSRTMLLLLSTNLFRSRTLLPVSATWPALRSYTRNPTPSSASGNRNVRVEGKPIPTPPRPNTAPETQSTRTYSSPRLIKAPKAQPTPATKPSNSTHSENRWSFDKSSPKYWRNNSDLPLWRRHRLAIKEMLGAETWNPTRKLSREKMENIRLLFRTDPAKNTVPHLAEKFLISPEAVRRILRSKFTPTHAVRDRQEAKLQERILATKEWKKAQKMEKNESEVPRKDMWRTEEEEKWEKDGAQVKRVKRGEEGVAQVGRVKRREEGGAQVGRVKRREEDGAQVGRVKRREEGDAQVEREQSREVKLRMVKPREWSMGRLLP